MHPRGSGPAGVGRAAVHWQPSACQRVQIPHPCLRPMCGCALHIAVIIAIWKQAAKGAICKLSSCRKLLSAASDDAGKLRVYVFSEMLALFARERYDTSLSDLSNLASHLTNTCRQPDAAEGRDAAATGARFGSAPAAVGAALPLPNGHSRPADNTAQQPDSGSAGSAGADSYSEADVVRLLSELPRVRLPQSHHDMVHD